MRTQFLSMLLLFLSLALPVSLTAQELPTDDRVTIGTLDNGMRYYIMENEKPEDRAELRLAVNAGSILEDEDQQGIAHFVEHMAFNGTENFEENELIDYLELTGTRFGPDLNAYTSFDETVYMLQVRTDSQEIFDTGLQIMRDWAGGVTFSGEEIDKERGVVISEWRTRLSPEQRMQQVYFPVLYNDSRYAERLPIGKVDIIENISYDRVEDFYEDWYRPELMSIVVVGDIDPQKVESQLKDLFSDLEDPSAPRPRKEFEVPFHEEPMVAVATDEEASFTNVRLTIKHPKFKVTDVESYRQKLTHDLYNQMLNSRLDELAQQADAPFVYAYSGYGSDVGNIDAYRATAMVPEGGAEKGLKTLLKELKRVRQHGFTPAELDRAKQKMMESAERSVREKDKQNSSGLSMRFVYHYLKDNPIPGPEQMLGLYREHLTDISLSQVNDLPNHWLTDENRVIIVTGPETEAKPLPKEEDILRMHEEVKSIEVEPYTEESLDAPLVSNVPQAGRIDSKTSHENSGITELTFDNGIKAVLKSTDFQNDQILFSAYSPGGHSLYSDEEYFAVSQSGSVIDQCGYGNYSSTDLSKKLSGQTVEFSPYVSSYSEGMRGSSSVKDFETLLQLIHLAFTAPREDEELLQAYIKRNQGIYQNLMSNPQYYFFDFVQRTIYENHPRMGFPSMEDFEQLSMSESLKYFRERFGNPADFTFFFVGNLELDKAEEQLALYLGSLESNGTREEWNDFGASPLRTGMEKTIRRGQADKTNVDIRTFSDATYSEEDDRIVDAMIGVLRIKLRENLREDKGGVYGVRLNGGLSRIPEERFGLIVSFNSEPERTDELIREVYREIDTLIAEGPQEVDVKKVKETEIQSYKKQFKENRFWLSSMREIYQYDKDPEKLQLDLMTEKMESVTGEQIHKAAKKYLGDAEWIQMVMHPEEDEK